MAVQVVYLFLPQVFISSLWYFPSDSMLLSQKVLWASWPKSCSSLSWFPFVAWKDWESYKSSPPHWIGCFPITAGPSPSLSPLGICQVSLVPIYSLGYREILIVTQPTILAPGSLNWEPISHHVTISLTMKIVHDSNYLKFTYNHYFSMNSLKE